MGSSVPDFLFHPYFLQAGVPLLCAAIGVGVKCATRNDKHTAFKKEDIAVGLDLMVTSCLAYVVIAAERGMRLNRLEESIAVMTSAPTISDPASLVALQQQATEQTLRNASSPWWVLGLFLILGATSTLVRKFGWEGPDDLRLWRGIVFPLAFGVLTLAFVMTQASA